ncbi:MAG: hypothetical protein ABGY21_11835, partial [Pseudomonadota bacterium]
MGLETGTYIDSLNAANPTATDPKSEGDDHLRLLKSTIKSTLPNVTGAVTATHTELNLLDGVTATTAELNLIDGVTATTAELNWTDGVTSAIQTQIDTKQASATAVTKTSTTGSASLPSGTTAQRDGSPTAGYLRWNTTDTSAEVYDGSAWAAVGGGNSTTEGLYEMANTISSNYSITSGNNALTAGPITINTGISVT